MNTSPDFDTDYDRLKADVASMRINCVTRADLRELEDRLVAQLNRISANMEQMNANIQLIALLLTELRTEYQTQLPHLATKAALHEFGSSIRAWMVTAMISMFLGFTGLAFVVVRSI
jgi:hypothetical protein